MLCLNLLFETRDTDFKELVEIRTDNTEELQPFQKGILFVECLIEHTLVKFQPAQAAVDKERGIIKFHAPSMVRRILFRSRGHLSQSGDKSLKSGNDAVIMDEAIQIGGDAFWENWQPTMRASLCFVRREGTVLMIRKKRGLGAGKINGPGGRLEPGETALEAAIRETREEVGVTPLHPSPRGELHFQFTNGLALHCVVFLAEGCTGEVVETDEATPFWMEPSAIPYHDMWADDIHWLPGVLEGKTFRGYFHFDEEKMMSKEVVWLEG